MSGGMAAALVLAAALVGRRRVTRWVVPALPAAVGLVVALPVTLGVLAGLIGRRSLRDRRRRVARHRAADDDVSLLVELTLLGLTAGRSFSGALSEAARHVHPDLGSEVDRVLRAARTTGIAAALHAATGRAVALYRLAARATLTGASLVDALSALVAETRAARRAAALADVRRLSVRLLFPLALLILPGFVVLVAGPVVIDGIARLDL